MAAAISSKVSRSAGADPVSASIAAVISADPVDTVVESAFSANRSVDRCADPLVLSRSPDAPNLEDLTSMVIISPVSSTTLNGSRPDARPFPNPLL